MASQTKTVVFTDLANYTASTARANRNELRQLVEDHERHTIEIFEPYGGEIIKNIGDAYLALFNSATDALKACMQLVESSITFGNTEMRFRASAATGDIELISGDCFGEAVNLSARINSKTPVGEVWFANRTRLCMNQKEIPWESIGIFDFKGIGDPVECFRAISESQCYIPEVLIEKHAASQTHTIDTSTDIRRVPIRNTDHIILIGFDMNTPELAQRKQQLAALVPNSSVWLQQNNLSNTDRQRWIGEEYKLIISTPQAISTALSQIPKDHSTIVQTLMFELPSVAGQIKSVGVALPKVPLPSPFAGFKFDILNNGQIVQHSEEAAFSILVMNNTVSLRAHSSGVRINNIELKLGIDTALPPGCTIVSGTVSFRFFPLQINYHGIIVGGEELTYDLETNTPVELGRDPEQPGWHLRERGKALISHNNQISVVLPGGKPTPVVDRILMGRRQARIVVTNEATVEHIHKRLPSWKFANGRLSQIREKTNLRTNEYLVLGTHLLKINLA